MLGGALDRTVRMLEDICSADWPFKPPMMMRKAITLPTAPIVMQSMNHLVSVLRSDNFRGEWTAPVWAVVVSMLPPSPRS